MVTLLTALTIQESKTFVHPYQQRGSDSWGYAITLGEEDWYRPLITCKAIYSSETEAKGKGDELVAKIREALLDPYDKVPGSPSIPETEEIFTIAPFLFRIISLTIPCVRIICEK